MQRDTVVGPDRLHLEAERLAQARAQRECPRRVDARTERRQDADAPVADLVAEALDDYRAIARDGARRLLLLAEKRDQIPGCERRQTKSDQLVEVGLIRFGNEVPREAADLLAELVRPADALALPERDRAGHARSGRDEHAVACDLLDPPRARAEQEDLSRPG